MLKRLGVVLGAVAALLVLAVIVKFYFLSPRSRPAQDQHAPHTPEAIARGKYLVDNVTGCLGCHSQIDEAASGEPPLPGRLGSGRDFGVIPDFPGRIRAPNLTPDLETGIASWSDGELLRAMREGVSKNGRPLFPMMPYGAYGRALSDDDALAIGHRVLVEHQQRSGHGYRLLLRRGSDAGPRRRQGQVGPGPVQHALALLRGHDRRRQARVDLGLAQGASGGQCGTPCDLPALTRQASSSRCKVKW
jgi:hypothetical protein